MDPLGLQSATWLAAATGRGRAELTDDVLDASPGRINNGSSSPWHETDMQEFCRGICIGQSAAVRRGR